MTFNQPDPQLFRATLQKAGYCAEWKAKYGPEAWSLLEKICGELSSSVSTGALVLGRLAFIYHRLTCIS
jgi:hypothetical protein